MHKISINKSLELIKKCSALVFDFDGVLVDSVSIKTSAFEAMYKNFGIHVSDKVKEHHIANGGMSRKEKFYHYHKNFLNITLNKNEIDVLSNIFSDLVTKKIIESPEIKGSRKFLEKCKFDNKFCFINSATPFYDLKKITSKRKIDNFFNSIYGSESSKVENLKTIFNDFNISPKQTLFFGDALADLEASFETKCNFIGIGNDFRKIINSIERKEKKVLVIKDFQMLV
tara:strand:- start:5502 stop:6185 length:684 start_codon:yes stop_codon:yes gene_type:complete